MTVTHYLTFYIVYDIQRFRFVSYLHKPMIVVALYGIGQTIIFSSCGLFLSLFSSPNVSGRTLDVYHTSTHDVVLVRI